MSRNLFILLIGLSFAACTNNVPTDYGTEIGALAPPIEATSVNGEAVNLASMHGSYVIIEFYASWCGPCHKELPKLKSLFAEKQEFNGPIEVISIALEKDKKTGEKFLEQTAFPWSYQILNESRYVRFDPIASDYGVTDIPSSFLLDPEGRILAAYSSIGEIRIILEGL